MDNAYRQVLVIDGDPATRQMLAEWLAHAGHVVYTAADRGDALTYLMEADLDLIISEYSMGRSNGREWFQFLQSHLPDVQVIIVTGLPAKLVSSRWPVLRKPVDLDALERHVSHPAPA